MVWGLGLCGLVGVRTARGKIRGIGNMMMMMMIIIIIIIIIIIKGL